MCSECRVFPMVFGHTKRSHITFMDGLRSRLKLREVSTLNYCDIIIAFVSVVSRAGTDIGAALQKIPSNYPVILLVLHHTFDKDCVVPDSRHAVNRRDVFTVDCLYHEDLGLLKAQRNSEAMNAVINKIKEIRKIEMKENPAFSLLGVVETYNKPILCILALLNTVLIHLILFPEHNTFIVYVFALSVHTIIFVIMTNKGYERFILMAFLAFTLCILICFVQTLSSLLLLKHEPGDGKLENHENEHE